MKRSELRRLIEQVINEAKIVDKDWQRMLDLVLANKDGESVAKAITDKNKAIARFVAGTKLRNAKLDYHTNWKTYYGYFADFGNKALKLGATPEEIQTAFDETEVPSKFSDKLTTLGGKDKKLNNRFVSFLTQAILKAGYDITFLPYSGNAITSDGEDAMRRNGRKWTIGYKSEITKDGKKYNLVFDAITDEGDGPTKYVIAGRESDKVFTNHGWSNPTGPKEFLNTIMNGLSK